MMDLNILLFSHIHKPLVRGCQTSPFPLVMAIWGGKCYCARFKEQKVLCRHEGRGQHSRLKGINEMINLNILTEYVIDHHHNLIDLQAPLKIFASCWQEYLSFCGFFAFVCLLFVLFCFLIKNKRKGKEF